MSDDDHDEMLCVTSFFRTVLSTYSLVVYLVKVQKPSAEKENWWFVHSAKQQAHKNHNGFMDSCFMCMLGAFVVSFYFFRGGRRILCAIWHQQQQRFPTSKLTLKVSLLSSSLLSLSRGTKTCRRIFDSGVDVGRRFAPRMRIRRKFTWLFIAVHFLFIMHTFPRCFCFAEMKFNKTFMFYSLRCGGKILLHQGWEGDKVKVKPVKCNVRWSRKKKLKFKFQHSPTCATSDIPTPSPAFLRSTAASLFDSNILKRSLCCCCRAFISLSCARFPHCAAFCAGNEK